MQCQLLGVYSKSYVLAIQNEAELLKRDRSPCLADTKLLRVFSVLTLVLCILCTNWSFEMESEEYFNVL